MIGTRAGHAGLRVPLTFGKIRMTDCVEDRNNDKAHNMVFGIYIIAYYNNVTLNPFFSKKCLYHLRIGRSIIRKFPKQI